jgi:hypothetical protein
MAGGKGGSTTTTVEVPQYIEDAARANLERADLISKIGFVPYFGPDVAAFTPQQEAAFAGTQQLAGAFGTPTTMDMGVPAPQTFAGGVRGYSSAPMFEQAQRELGRRRPAQKAFIDSLFIDPFSGQYSPIDMGTPAPPPETGPGGSDPGGSGSGGSGPGGSGPGAPSGPPVDPGPITVETSPGEFVTVDPPRIPYIPPELPPVVLPPPQGPLPPGGEFENIVPPGEAQPGDIIAETDLDALNKKLIGTGFEIPDVPGQRYQFFNPDINYSGLIRDEFDGPYRSPSTGQFVGTLEPSAEGIKAAQAGARALGNEPMDADFFEGIRSASDFPVGLSTQGYDFSTYASPDKRGVENLATNPFGSTVSVGYGAGQVDPRLAAGAGYKPVEPPKPEGFLQGLLGSLPPPNVPIPVATQNRKEREEQKVLSAISSQGGQNLIDQGALASEDLTSSQKGIISSRFGNLTTDQVAANAAMDSTIEMGRKFSENGKLIKEAAANGNLGAAVDSIMDKYGSNLSKLQEKGKIPQAIMEDIKKIAAAKG